jgi:hypothetical protein
MTKNKLQLVLLLASSLTILTACLDKDLAGGSTVSNKHEQALDINTLIEQAEQARAEAGRLGFEWSVTGPLLEVAHATYKAGNHEQATTLFQEVKLQSLLAIDQARYADENWRMLVPVID